jgi:hypothetical protein
MYILFLVILISGHRSVIGRGHRSSILRMRFGVSLGMDTGMTLKARAASHSHLLVQNNNFSTSFI